MGYSGLCRTHVCGGFAWLKMTGHVGCACLLNNGGVQTIGTAETRGMKGLVEVWVCDSSTVQ